MAAQWLAKWSQAFSKFGAGGGDAGLRPGVRACRDYLIEHRERVVGKEELFREIWRGRVVTEQSLFQCIGEIRAAHGKASVRTYPGRGYQWQGTVRRRSALAKPAAAFAAIAVAAAAAQIAAVGEDDATARSATVAVLPAADDAVELEGALIDWLSIHVPANLVTGTESLAAARDGRAEVAVDVGLQRAGDDEWRGRYRVVTNELTLAGELDGSDLLELASEIGTVVRETYLHGQTQAEDPTARRLATYSAALSHSMAGRPQEAAANARMLLAEDPDFLPAHRLMAELDIAGDRLPAALQRIEVMQSKAARYGDPAWRTAALLAEVDYHLASNEAAAAESAARAALDAARSGGLARDAGKAAERLAAVGLERGRRTQAMNWLVDAHAFYTEGQCTVGTARVDRKLRELLSQAESSG